MTNYNYLESIKEDIKNYIENDSEFSQDELLYNRDELESKLNEDLWTEDSITGNGSGSYTFDRYKAMEYVTDNMNLLSETCNELDISSEAIGERFMNEDWEWMDVSIRCYLLSQAINEVLDDIKYRLPKEA